jgi:hypothetical protein
MILSLYIKKNKIGTALFDSAFILTSSFLENSADDFSRLANYFSNLDKPISKLIIPSNLDPALVNDIILLTNQEEFSHEENIDNTHMN